MIMNQELRPLKPVYSYLFPEVRDQIKKVRPENLNQTLLRSVNPGLDDFHKSFLSDYKKYFDGQLIGLNTYPFEYVSSGASEGIFHLLAQEKARNPGVKVYTLEGEYEGYAGYGRNLNIECIGLNSVKELKNKSPSLVFVSNPNARDGNSLDKKEWETILESGHRVIYDATYVGLTDKFSLDLNHRAIEAVMVSLSKPFGLYYLRLGAVFSRNSMPTLEVNKWFKNVHSIMVGREVLKNIPPGSLIKKYRPQQHLAIKQMNRQYGLEAKPSEVILLANQKIKSMNSTEKWGEIGSYKRGNGYRFCLTPYLLNQEKND